MGESMAPARDLVFSGAATIAALLVSFWCGLRVGLLRDKLGVKAPATSGPPAFERAFRVQMNTMEQLTVFLPLLWLATFFLRGWTWIPAALGLVWAIARIVYANAYMADPDKRSFGFRLGLFATLGLLIASIVGLVQTFLSARA
jgi:glutathione S-transferase